MGIDYCMYPVIGYRVDQKMVEHLRVEVPEKFHMETRYDEKTGACKGPVKVVDEGGGYEYRFNGQSLDCFEDLCNEVAGKLKLAWDWAGDLRTEQGDFAYFLVPAKPVTTWDSDRIEVLSEAPLPQDIYSKLEKIKQKLAKVGIKVRRPVLAVGVQVS